MNGIRGANPGNGTFVAIHAKFLLYLQVKGTVPEGTATLDTFPAADAQILVDVVGKVGLLDVGPFNGRSRAELVLGSRTALCVTGFEITTA